MGELKFDCQTSLSPDEVLQIHSYVVDYFANEEPISPGIRSEDLLHSAVSRPFTGCPDAPKYPSVFLAAATLTFGLTKNHPFVDGNKRTAVIAMLAFLDLWKLQLVADVTHDMLYRLMIALTEDKLHEYKPAARLVVSDSHYYQASRFLKLPAKPFKIMRGAQKLEPDFSIYILSRWLSKYTRKKDFRDRRVTLRELKDILRKFNIRVEQLDGTTYAIIREKPPERKVGLVRRWLAQRSKEENEKRESETCYRIHVGGLNRPIGIDQIKKLKSNCGLSDYDYHAFYGDRTPADYFLLQHSRVLRRLAKYDRLGKS